MSKFKILLAVCSCSFAGLLINLTDIQQEALLHQHRNNFWKSFSNNRYSYNICTLSPDQYSRETEGNRPELPMAHRTFHNAGWAKKRCFLTPEDSRPWKRGLLSSSLTRQLPPSCTMCHKLFLGKELSKNETHWIEKANAEMLLQKIDLTTNTMNCSWVQNEFSNNFYVTDAEIDFSIAYAININTELLQIIHFLKVIYRPQNVYCLHFDQKSRWDFKQVFFNIATCLDNVIVPRRIENEIGRAHV